MSNRPVSWPVWKRLSWLTALAFVFLLPYVQLEQWGFPHSTAALLALLLLRHRRRWLDRAGIPTRPRAIAATRGLLVLLWVLFRHVLVPGLAERRGLALDPWPAAGVAAFGFQALNEEVVLGALPLFALVRRCSRPRLVAVALAIAFTALHWLLYRYGSLASPVQPATLAALLAVGVVRNAAILLAGHVGYAWALHAAWNLAMFAGTWRLEATGATLSEPEVLDALVGHPVVLGGTALLATLLLLLGGRAWQRAAPAGAAAN
jgi:hypothetical protein